jgi:hypothetical protein
MDKPLFILKPSSWNALSPLFFKNLFYSTIFGLILLLIYFLLNYFNIINYSFNFILIVLIIFVLIISFFPLIMRIIILANTNYYFYRTHITSEFKLFFIKSYSLSYSKITNISLDISIWDRLCNAGDIILHSAEDKKEDLKLAFIKNPKEIEKRIYALAHHQTNNDPHLKS